MEFPEKQRKRSNQRKCCVKNCSSQMNKNTNLSFHRVPKFGSMKIERVNMFGKIEIVDKRTEWLRRINIEDKKNYLEICSLHFDENDYNFPDIHVDKRFLKRNAVPKAVIPSKEKRMKNAERRERVFNRKRENKPVLDDKQKYHEKSMTQKKIVNECKNMSNNFEIDNTSLIKTDPDYHDEDIHVKKESLNEVCESNANIKNVEFVTREPNAISFEGSDILHEFQKICSNYMVIAKKFLKFLNDPVKKTSQFNSLLQSSVECQTVKRLSSSIFSCINGVHNDSEKVEEKYWQVSNGDSTIFSSSSIKIEHDLLEIDKIGGFDL